VTLIEKANQVLPGWEPEAAHRVAEALEMRGVNIDCGRLNKEVVGPVGRICVQRDWLLHLRTFTQGVLGRCSGASALPGLGNRATARIY
jgi:hypothetical protein